MGGVVVYRLQVGFTVVPSGPSFNYLCRFHFERVHARAIEEIDNSVPGLDPIRRLVIAREQVIPGWHLAAYLDMCKAPDFVSDDDAEVLGARETARLARAKLRISRLAFAFGYEDGDKPGKKGGSGFFELGDTFDRIVIENVKEIFEL